MFADLKEEKSIWEEMFKMFMSVNICKYFSSSLAQKTWQCIFVKIFIVVIMVKILMNIKCQHLEYVLAKGLILRQNCLLTDKQHQTECT